MHSFICILFNRFLQTVKIDTLTVPGGIRLLNTLWSRNLYFVAFLVFLLSKKIVELYIVHGTNSTTNSTTNTRKLYDKTRNLKSANVYFQLVLKSLSIFNLVKMLVERSQVDEPANVVDRLSKRSTN